MYISLQKLLDRQSLFIRRVNGRSLYFMMISEDLRTDLLDAHHVYRSPEMHVVAEPLTNNSQFLLESLHAYDHVSIASLRRCEQLFQQLYVSQRVTRIILVIQSPPSVKTHLVLVFAMSTQFSLAATRGMSDSEIG